MVLRWPSRPAGFLLYQLVWSQFFLFFVWIPGFLILYGLLEKEFPVFHHYGYWLPFYMGWILFLPLHYHLLFTKLSTNIFCILQVISISFILSTVEHWGTFIFALFVRKTCTLYDMVLKRHKMNSPNFKVYSTIYLSLCGSNGRSGGPWQTKLVSHCVNFLHLRMLSKVIVLPYPGTFKIQKGNYHYQLTE